MRGLLHQRRLTLVPLTLVALLSTACTQRTNPQAVGSTNTARNGKSALDGSQGPRDQSSGAPRPPPPALDLTEGEGAVATMEAPAIDSAPSAPEETKASSPTQHPKTNISPGALGLSGVGEGGGGAGMGFGSGHGRLGGSQLNGRVRGYAESRWAQAWNTENYQRLPESSFRSTRTDPLSTFSVDVDTASYSNVRRFLKSGTLPPIDSVRVEELINYFSYNDALPEPGRALSITSEVADCPWERRHRLVRIALRTPAIAQATVPARNLVFLLDVSGSMQSPDKLPLLKRGMGMLTETLRPKDKVSIVVYAGAAGLVLPPTSGTEKGAITAAIDGLEAGGSTNGGEGIELAYRVAQNHLVPSGINRVILATDGDFNVGVSSDGALTRLIEAKRKTGIFLTVLGFGTGNLKDSRMEALADKGNGNYAYIDSVAEARKVLVRQAGATLVTVAKDVKLQVEFNPTRVEEYRLVGYENRVLAKEDFNDDTKDAGEMGAAHTVTALYEVALQGSSVRASTPAVDALKYQHPAQLSPAATSPELLTLKVRYKAPSSEQSQLLSVVVRDVGGSLEKASADFRFSAAVANFGLLLGKSKFAAQSSLASLRRLAAGALGPDPHKERAEFLTLVDTAKALASSSRVLASAD